QVGLGKQSFTPDRRQSVRSEIIERLQAIPGVEAVAETNVVPLSGDATSNNVWLEGATKEQQLAVLFSWVGPGYFKTLQQRLIAGREFDKRDALTSNNVAIVNETFARRMMNGADPVGRSFWREATPNDPETRFEIIGLVKDTKYSDLRETSQPVIFLSVAQFPRPYSYSSFLVRSRVPQSEMATAVKRAIYEINPAIDVRLQGFRTMIEESLLGDRLMATLSGFFGGLALILASIGLYGILSYGVASRTNEIGIRMALGARSRDVLSLILREALILVLIGLVVGLPAILGVTRFASTLLFGITPTDPLS